jgi:release factor glutamine methyltransferase
MTGTHATRLSQALAGAQATGLDRLDAQMLLLHVLARDPHDRAWLMTHDTDTLNADQLREFDALVQRRTHGEPLAYLTGIREFHGLNLQVDARVLDPRADTETLVQWAIDALDALTTAPTHDGPAVVPPRLIDLGTGSGAIALAVKHARPHADVTAVDASTDALAVARVNAKALGLAVHVVQGLWLQGLSHRFDVIVSNPPYLANDDPHLAALKHEPLQALVSGPDGLEDIRRIISQAPAHLAPRGWLLLEHGWDQASAVRALLKRAGFEAVQSRCDLAGIERCTGGQWTGCETPAPT